MDQEKKKPVLLFTSREICYYSADFFMNQMAEAFETLGYPARLCVLDLEKDVDAQLAPYVGNSYTAVLDINSLLPRRLWITGHHTWSSWTHRFIIIWWITRFITIRGFPSR